MSQADTDAAIAAALSSDWQKALEINNKILSECPADVDCLNRVGKAYLELGDYKKAALTFRKVLKIDKYDPIATRNLARVTQTTPAKRNTDHKTISHSSIISFLEEPGKTRIIQLVNLAPSRTLLRLDNADPVQLVLKRHSVFVEDLEGNYLGALPDDIAHRILILIKGGNKYDGFIKSCHKNILSVFVRETLRAKKFHNTPSFPASGADYLSFIREDSTLETESPAPVTVDATDSEDEVAFSKAEKMHSDEETEE